MLFCYSLQERDYCLEQAVLGSKKATKEAAPPLLAQLPHGAFHAQAVDKIADHVLR